MPRLAFYDLDHSRQLVVVSNVIMPNGERRQYSDFGKEGLTRILKRIKTEKLAMKLAIAAEFDKAARIPIPASAEVLD